MAQRLKQEKRLWLRGSGGIQDFTLEEAHQKGMA